MHSIRRLQHCSIAVCCAALLPFLYVLSAVCLQAAEYRGWIIVSSNQSLRAIYAPLRWAVEAFPWLDRLLYSLVQVLADR